MHDYSLLEENTQYLGQWTRHWKPYRLKHHNTISKIGSRNWFVKIHITENYWIQTYPCNVKNSTHITKEKLFKIQPSWVKALAKSSQYTLG